MACRDLGHKGVKEIMIVEFDYDFKVIMSNPMCSGEETFYTECDSVEWAYQGDCAPGTGRAAVICDVEEPGEKVLCTHVSNVSNMSNDNNKLCLGRLIHLQTVQKPLRKVDNHYLVNRNKLVS